VEGFVQLTHSGSNQYNLLVKEAGNTKGGRITILLTSCLTGLDKSVLKIKTKIVSCHTADSKPVKQLIPHLVFPVESI